MNKTPAQMKIFEAQVRKRVEKQIHQELDEIVKELEEAEFGGDVHMAAIEVLGSVAATMDNYISTVVLKDGGVVKQEYVKDPNSDN